jgi:hypothetical protein
MFEQAFKKIDDILWKDAGCTSELDYTEQSSWRLFLKYLDALERGLAARLPVQPFSFLVKTTSRRGLRPTDASLCLRETSATIPCARIALARQSAVELRGEHR